ncbi:hypothetical protein EJ04DRAFT_580200 [Polyplosphaeria fusca]|uniref:Uncharacterized protein n=1 Tax=Polyplosphaeria fusca TaxID=682080 RepID=A0A9P4UYF8_9PLEO|nr:hypothetical protein EJ04DRAFT_580200 [Polyplosphaeria fusca]
MPGSSSSTTMAQAGSPPDSPVMTPTSALDPADEALFSEEALSAAAEQMSEHPSVFELPERIALQAVTSEEQQASQEGEHPRLSELLEHITLQAVTSEEQQASQEKDQLGTATEPGNATETINSGLPVSELYDTSMNLEAYDIRTACDEGPSGVMWTHKIDHISLSRKSIESHLQSLGTGYSVIDAIAKLLPEEVRLIKLRVNDRKGNLLSASYGDPSDIVTKFGTFPVKPVIFILETSLPIGPSDDPTGATLAARGTSTAGQVLNPFGTAGTVGANASSFGRSFANPFGGFGSNVNPAPPLSPFDSPPPPKLGRSLVNPFRGFGSNVNPAPPLGPLDSPPRPKLTLVDNGLRLYTENEGRGKSVYQSIFCFPPYDSLSPEELRLADINAGLAHPVKPTRLGAAPRVDGNVPKYNLKFVQWPEPEQQYIVAELQTIFGFPPYRDLSFEELRLADTQAGLSGYVPPNPFSTLARPGQYKPLVSSPLNPEAGSSGLFSSNGNPFAPNNASTVQPNPSVVPTRSAFSGFSFGTSASGPFGPTVPAAVNTSSSGNPFRGTAAQVYNPGGGPFRINNTATADGGLFSNTNPTPTGESHLGIPNTVIEDLARLYGKTKCSSCDVGLFFHADLCRFYGLCNKCRPAALRGKCFLCASKASAGVGKAEGGGVALNNNNAGSSAGPANKGAPGFEKASSEEQHDL